MNWNVIKSYIHVRVIIYSYIGIPIFIVISHWNFQAKLQKSRKITKSVLTHPTANAHCFGFTVVAEIKYPNRKGNLREK